MPSSFRGTQSLQHPISRLRDFTKFGGLRRPFAQWIETLVLASPSAAELPSIPVPRYCMITHWDRVTHICINKLTRIGSDHGLSPGRCQAIIWTNAGILLIGPLGTNFIEILIETHTFSFKKMLLIMSSGKCRPSCLGLNMITTSRDDQWQDGSSRYGRWATCSKTH